MARLMRAAGKLYWFEVECYRDMVGEAAIIMGILLANMVNADFGRSQGGLARRALEAGLPPPSSS